MKIIISWDSEIIGLKPIISEKGKQILANPKAARYVLRNTEKFRLKKDKNGKGKNH